MRQILPDAPVQMEPGRILPQLNTSAVIPLGFVKAGGRTKVVQGTRVIMPAQHIQPIAVGGRFFDIAGGPPNMHIVV